MLFHETADSFLEEVVKYKDAKYVVVPVPLDMTTTYLKGTKFGPGSIIEASRSLENYDLELNYDLRDKIFTTGHLELPPDVIKSMTAIKETVADLLADKKMPVLLGGEHTITYGASMSFDSDVLFVIFDAHADFKKDLLDVEVNHASNSRLVNKRNEVCLVGVRSLNLEEKTDLKKKKLPVFYAEDLKDKKSVADLAKIAKGRKIYISIDMDVFDPSIAPGVGTPQPAGISYESALELLKVLVENGKLVGFDVTELRPINDNKITEVLAAKLIIDIIALNERTAVLRRLKAEKNAILAEKS